MNYSQTLEYLFTHLPMYHRIGDAAYRKDLNNTLELCKLLGEPHHFFPSVHVAGTNGKGSVSHFLASILQECGYKTGLYTSPHLKDFRERILINGQKIPRGKVTRFIKNYEAEFARIHPSFFEMTVGLAFDYFREEKVDIAVIEAGLGGRLDSTNVITPILSIITNISIDHTQYLGNTIESIAGEKAGIIKPGIPVVIGESHPVTKDLFSLRAHELQAEITFADEIFKSELVHPEFFHSGKLVLDIEKNGKPFFKKLESPLSGLYQQKNIITVLAAIQPVISKGFTIKRSHILQGIQNVVKNTGLKGRWQIISHSPLTICDTGHNSGGLSEVLRQINNISYHNLHFIFGMVNEKDTGTILSLLPKNADYYFCKAKIPRGKDALELSGLATAKGLKGKAYTSVRKALEAARKRATENDLIFIGGSTFVVAEVL